MRTPILWDKGSTEHKVSKFYGIGVENFCEFHGGHLNFGYWELGNDDYIKAAECLVFKLGQMLNLSDESTLLDVACGMGAQDIFLAQNFPLKSIQAYDLMYEHLVHAEQRVKQFHLEDKINLTQGTATNIPFPSESFSHILCIEGIVHFNTREKFFFECYRLLRPGGRVVFSDYVLKKSPESVWGKILLKMVTRVWNVPAENVNTIESYEKKLEKSGFTNIIIHAVGEKVIPGYCREQSRPECIKELIKIRGWAAGRLGHVIDIILNWSYKFGLIDYVLVEADIDKEAR